MKTLLHVCSYYAGSAVYRNLVKSLAGMQFVNTQHVFAPVRNTNLKGRNILDDCRIRYETPHCLNNLTRISYGFKQLRLRHAFSASSFQPLSFDLVHAHSLYSDGPLAYAVSKSLGVPLVVTIRGTDVNIADRLLPQWRPLVRRILDAAQRVVFVSPSHQSEMLSRYPQITDSAIIPNGLDPYWVDNRLLHRERGLAASTISAIYVGSFTKNKNLNQAIECFLGRTDGGFKRRFLIAGGTKADYTRVFGRLHPHLDPAVTFLGEVTDKDQLRRLIRSSNLLVMPSFSETFGLVYLEAISQATPVVYSRNQGIDGYFPDGSVGFSCNPHDPRDISRALECTLSAFPDGLDFRETGQNPVEQFSWSKIAERLVSEAYR